jgi:HEAT repeat protein
MSGRLATFRYTLLLSLTVLVPFTGCVQETPSSPTGTVSILLSLIHDEDAEVRRTAVESLGKIGEQAVIHSVADLLTDRSPLVRRAAAQAVGRLGQSAKAEVVPRLLRMLNDSDGGVRRAASAAISELEPPPELLGTVTELLTSTNVDVRRATVLALYQIDASPLLGSLRKVIQDSDPEIRQGAVAVLGETGIPSAVPLIRERLVKDSDPGVRAEAAYRLRVVTDKSARTALKRTADTDANQSVRRWAQQEPTL